jgi:VanZ family protein
MPHTRLSPARLVAALAAIGVVSLLTLAPWAFVHPLRGRVVWLLQDVAAPVMTWLPGGPDQVLNTLLFIPLGATLALLLPRRAWLVAIVAGFALSALVEIAQESIPGRVPDAGDVLWNTCGGAIGVILVTLVRAIGSVQRGR